jgi:hypothetical protein
LASREIARYDLETPGNNQGTRPRFSEPNGPWGSVRLKESGPTPTRAQPTPTLSSLAHGTLSNDVPRVIRQLPHICLSNPRRNIKDVCLSLSLHVWTLRLDRTFGTMFSLCLAVCLAMIPRDGTTFDQHSKSTRNSPGHSSCADSFSAYWGLTIDLLSFDFRVSLRSQSRFRG